MKLTRKYLFLSLLVVLVSCENNEEKNQPKESTQKVSDRSDGVVSSGDDKAQNKRGAPNIQTIVGTPQHGYINQQFGGGAGIGTASPATIAAVGPVAYTSYGHPHPHQAFSGGGTQLVQNAAAASPQTVYHKINYVAPNAALKVATFASPGHYEYASAAAAATPVLAKYNYAAAIPQYQYAHYPQYQVVQHHQTPGATIITTATHPHQLHQAAATTYHQHQPVATYITAHQPAAFHYTLTAAQPLIQQHQQQQQQHNYHQSIQTQHGHAPVATIHYHQTQQQQPAAAVVGVQPSVPVIHQAPLASINQVHQASQMFATQAQLAKYPTIAPIYPTQATASNQIYHQATNYAYPIQFGPKQIVPTVATPSQLKQLIPVTTATTTHHNGKGISYAAFTQQANPATLQQLQSQSAYYNTAAAASNLQQHQQNHLNQQYQQPRIQLYSTVATPLQKPAILYSSQYAQPSIPAAIYATSMTPLLQHSQQQQQQQQHQSQSHQPIQYGTHLLQQQQSQSYMPLAKITYTPGAASLQKGFYPVQ
ncbi:putative mediator of RNA polymerase II transcription subunit 26 isoform X1 [Toxorhynchites rutilus septentrionalis]|uniref:putative mediator of RNA polymerase II transcription subunit 26 isoform X1 n=1 Tax=Toxorhynchites rutilus septentrionalis TaxID=329112 RepID=UPI00247ABE75|nr:putative mediator of RNA polymerase II transcription subunit 26 isoform X1 [Toxorhynchites rutilus septentrionalis]